MSIKAGTSLRVSRLIQAEPETVFRAWTEPAHLKRWSAPEGITVEVAQVDLKVGGRYRLGMRTAEGKPHTAVGTYREIVRPTRLVYTWSWEEGESTADETLVTVEFNAVGGATEVVLTHERFATAESRDDHLQGWTSCLDRLEAIYA
jgi:uncharacterized protein YndB with AHSA1/START domain